MRKKIHLLLSAISLGSSHGVLNLFFCLLITSLLGVVLKARRTVTYQVIFFLFLRHNTCTFYSKMVANLVLFSSYIGINSYIFLLVFEAYGSFFFLCNKSSNYKLLSIFLVTESVQLSRAVLLVNAECYTAWNARQYTRLKKSLISLEVQTVVAHPTMLV